MKKTLLGLAALLLLLPHTGLATTYNTPTVDGPATVDPADWDADELLHEDPVGDSAWGPYNDLQGLWVTWDEENLYLAVSGALWDVPAGSGGGSNSVNLYLDVDFGQGTGIADLSEVDQNALGAVSRNFWRPLQIGDGFGADYGFTSWAGLYDRGFLDITDPAAPVNLLEASAVGENQESCPEGSLVCVGLDLSGKSGYELKIPWSTIYTQLYPDRAGIVPAGARIAVVVAIVGGGDSLSPESMPDGADDRIIERPLVYSVDSDGDGVPDPNWPPQGRIAGTVTLPDASDTTTVVKVVARDPASGAEIEDARTPPGGGEYLISRLTTGRYDVAVVSDRYLAPPRRGVDVVEGETTGGIDFGPPELIQVNSGVRLAAAFVDGPEAQDRSLEVAVSLTGTADVGIEIQREVVLGPGDALSALFRPVPAGTYRLTVTPRWPAASGATVPERSGYVPVRQEVTVPDNDTVVDLGTLDLALVEPTRLLFYEPTADRTGEAVTADFTTVSLPDLDFFAFLPVEVGLADEEGHEALYGQGSVQIQVSSMDPAFGPIGEVLLWDAEDSTQAVQPLADPAVWEPAEGAVPTGRARFLLTGDAQEVVRVEAVDGEGVLSGILEVGIQPIEPDEIVLQAAAGSMEAGGQIALSGQLLDVAGNPVREADFPILFRYEPDVMGLRPSQAYTGADGSFGTNGDVLFYSEVADTFTVTAVGTVSGREIASAPLTLVVRPGAPDHLELSDELAVQDGQVSVGYRILVADAFGNPSPRPGSTVSLTVGPPEIVAQAPATVDLDDATGEGSFRAEIRDGRFGVVEATASLAALPVPETTRRSPVLFGLAAVDEKAPESDPAHNSDPGADLTALYCYAENDTLVFQLPFSSDFGGLHMVLLLDVGGTPTGATQDYFGFPVTYTHPFLPDFVFTWKYQADDYADFRRPPPSGPPSAWQWYDGATGTWVDAFADGVNMKAQGWVEKDASTATFRVPVSVLGPNFTVGEDTLRAEVYIPQEEGAKRPALDSVPQDATWDMLPATGNWWDNVDSGRTELSQWAAFVPQTLPSALSLQDAGFEPELVTQGESTLLSVRPVVDAQVVPEPLLQVFADLSVFGGESLSPLNDEGREGDVEAGDGIYSLQVVIPAGQLASDLEVGIQATELNTGERASARAGLTIFGQPTLEPILVLEDEIGDDHGPNQPGRQFLYYTYPTNGVFFPGVFDLQRAAVFDAGTKLIFEVDLGEITSPTEPGAADWNASFPSVDDPCPQDAQTDLNLQNVVILLDTAEGEGATTLPENRWADVAVQDAWEYALVADGWWRGLVASGGSSNRGSWLTYPGQNDLFFCASADSDRITIVVDKQRIPELSGLDEEGVAAAVRSWDILVLTSGHDGDSNKDNWGAVRWVNESIAEWQFGGGRNGEGGRERDANIIDVLPYNGLATADRRKPAGRSQEEMLDFTTPEAQRRFAENQVAVQLEATELVDNVPPEIVFLNAPGRALAQWFILKDAPVSILAEVRDETGVRSARMLWRGVGQPRSENREVPLGLLRSDVGSDGVVHVADVPWSEFSAEGVTNVVYRRQDDGALQAVRYMIISFDAEDVLGNRTDPESRVEYTVEVPITPLEEFERSIPAADVVGATGDLVVDLPEGSQLTLPASAFATVDADTVGGAFTLRYRAWGFDELDLQPHGGKNETVLQGRNRFLQAARSFRLFYVDADSNEQELRILPETARFSIHFPWYEIEGTRAPDLQLFHWAQEAQRWVLVGGHGETSGSTITADVKETGIYAAFTKGSEIDGDISVTGLQLSPNPFSPNGDGIHDFLNITYVLTEEIDQANVEIFDMRGERVRVLKFQQPGETVNRTTGLIWDGKDESGRYVPLGIYICRVEVIGTQTKRWERATAAVAVVR